MGAEIPQFAASPRSDLHTRNQRASWSPQQQLLGVFLVLPGILGSSGRHRCGWKCGMELADFRDVPWSCSQGKTLRSGSASSSSQVHSPADPSVWEPCGSSRQDPLVLRDSQVPFPSLAAPLAPGASQRCTAGVSWGVGTGSSLAPTGTPEPSQTGDREQPVSAGWPFPAPSKWIKGLGASSCSGVSIRCRQEGLDGAGVFPKWGSDLSLSVLLNHAVSPRPLLCDPAAPCAVGETGIPCAAGLCPISCAGNQEILLCPGSAGARWALVWARGDGNLQWAGLNPDKLDFPRITAPPQQGLA